MVRINPFSSAFFPFKKTFFCEIPLSGTTSKQEKKEKKIGSFFWKIQYAHCNVQMGWSGIKYFLNCQISNIENLHALIPKRDHFSRTKSTTMTVYEVSIESDH
jgi:hypothetical protein